MANGGFGIVGTVWKRIDETYWGKNEIDKKIFCL